MKSKYFDLQKLAEGVYAAIINRGRGAVGNAGIIDLGDQTVVFDTFYAPLAAAELRAAAEELFERPVSVVVNSHWHSDHVCGNQDFTEAAILATQKTRELIASSTARFIQYAKAHRDYPQVLEEQLREERDQAKQAELRENLGNVQAFCGSLDGLILKLPTVTFQRSLQLHGTKRTAHLLCYGGGHTASDAFLYLPDEELIFMGDLLSIDNHSSVRDGNVREWISILDQVKELPISTAIPGHGPVGNSVHLTSQQDYLLHLLQTASRLAESGMAAEQVMQTAIPEPYKGWHVSSLYPYSLRQLSDQITAGQ